MGRFSRKLFPACGSVCVCCPTLRPRSRQPVKRYKELLADIFSKSLLIKRYKELLADIFSKSLEGNSNERKIVKLCEYASKNPTRIPKIAQYVEDIFLKEMGSGNMRLVFIAVEVFNKFLGICKEQLAYFAINLLNVVTKLLDDAKEDAVLICGCDTFTRFIQCQVDGTYARNVESFVNKVCMLANVTEDEHQGRALRASSLRCLSVMVWFMAENSHIFADFEKIVHVTLDNYEAESQKEERRPNGRGALVVGGELSPRHMIVRLQTERMDPSLLSRDEVEMPKIWAQICIQRMVDMAKESTTMRRVLHPMFVYFDVKKQWVPPHGLAHIVLSDMSSFVENPVHGKLILARVVRHLDHKNVAHDLQIKCHIIKTVSCLALLVRLKAAISDVWFVSDLFRHLRKSFQATGESIGEQELNLNMVLQTSIEACLLESVRGIVDVRPLFDMMAFELEKAVDQATLVSLTILAHVISLASVSFHSQQVFPEPLFIQLLKVMLHPDAEVRIGGQQIFCVLLLPSFARARNDVSNNQRRINSKSVYTFSYISLLERHRLEIYKKYFLRCDEDQIAELLSALWMQVKFPNNLPANIEAIAYSFNIALISCRLKNSNDNLLLRFFQLPLSIRKMASSSNNGPLPPTYQRSLFVLSTAMVMFAAKLYHVSETRKLLNLLLESDVDPYVGIDSDFQVYVKSQSKVKDYDSANDNVEALSILAELRDKAYESNEIVLSMLVANLSTILKIGAGYIAKQLNEEFVPDEDFMFGPQSMFDIQRAAHSQLFDREHSASSLAEDDDTSSVSSVADIVNMDQLLDFMFGPRSVFDIQWAAHSVGSQFFDRANELAEQSARTTLSTSPPPYKTMVNQCKASGAGTRKELSNWLTSKKTTWGEPVTGSVPPTDTWSSLSLPPISPFDNFLRAAHA